MSVVVIGMLGFAGFYACDRTDGITAERSNPELVAEGTLDDARWAVLRYREDRWTDCLELRQFGATVSRWCGPSEMLGQWQISSHVLPGTKTPLIFGILPDDTVRAEVALDGEAHIRREPNRATAPVEVLAFGGTGRFVAGPAPDSRTAEDDAWQGDVNIEVYDAAGNRIAPD